MQDKDSQYVDLHRTKSFNPGSNADLMSCQKLDVYGMYDDENTELGKEIRDAHVEVFRTAMSELAKELEKVLPALIAAAKVPKEYAVVVNALPSKMSWIRPHLFKKKGALNNDTEAVDFVYNVLKSEGDNGVTVLAKLQTAHGVMWWMESEKSGKAT